MNNVDHTHVVPNVLQMSDFIEQNPQTQELFNKIRVDMNSAGMLNPVLVCVDDMQVIPLSEILGSSASIQVADSLSAWVYEDWRNAEIESLPNDYDRERFRRSTIVETLCSKVREHLRYSFIVRTTADNEETNVNKYTFVRVTPDARYILCTRQDITQSLQHDTLTGGLNREGFLRELTLKFRQFPEGASYAILCFNIRNFHVINEVYGSATGDKVLQHMYTALVYSDILPLSYARYESDNFMCLVRRDTLDMDSVTRVCHHECVVDGKKIVFRCSCGIYDIKDLSISPFVACAHAKLASTFVKDYFLTPWMVYDKKMKQEGISDSEVLNQIEEAIKNKEFVPYFQPVVDSQTGRIVMAEALVRWKSPEHGMISPGVFIPVLERHGGLSRIDKIMEQCVFDLQRQRLADGLPVVPIDLNLSWTDFADTSLISQLQEHILDESVPTDLMRFEITESAYEEIAENRHDVLTFFQEHNVKLLVDDFGQGYSFGTMKNVNFDIVKLDKSLIDKLGQSNKMDMLVETFVSVFHKLNASLVAEGVESEEQARYLRRVGCDFIQGFFYYRPMDEASFIALLDKQNAADAEASEQKKADEANPETVWVEREVLEKQYAALKQADEEAKSLRMLLDELDIHYFEWDIRTHIDKAPDKFCRMYGMTTNEVLNMPESSIALVHPEDYDRFCVFYARAERGERMGYDYFRILAPDGKNYTWYRKTFYTLFDRDGHPYKAIMTMQDCADKFRYRILRSRDRLLTQQQGAPTFMYTVDNDTMSFTFLNPQGDVKTISIPNYLNAAPEDQTPDQPQLADLLRDRIKNGPRAGYVDFYDQRLKANLRGHYAMVDGEYGHLYAVVGQAEFLTKPGSRPDEQ